MESLAQNVWILPYTSEKRFLHRKEFLEFTYKNTLPAAYIMKTSFEKFSAGVSFSDSFV